MTIRQAFLVVLALLLSLVGAIAAEDERHEHGEHAPTQDHAVSEENASIGLDLYSLVVPFGIGTYSSLLITLLLGLFRRKLRRKFLILHRSFAFLTVVLASAHAALILILY